MTAREQLTNNIAELLLKHGINDEILRSKIILELDKYEVTERATELVTTDESDNENLIRSFALAKTISGCSAKTVKQYVNALHYFANHTQKKLIEVTAADIRSYTAYRIMDSGKIGVGLVNERQYLSTFFDWAVNNEVIRRNPIRQVEQIKTPQIHKSAFSEMEVEKIRNACTTPKEKAIVETLLSTACRVSELASIKISDIENDKIMVCGKGNKYGYVYLNSAAQLAIQNYLATRKDNNKALFPGCNGKHMTTSGIRRCLSKIGEKANVEDVHPHKFRHTAATSALRKGMKIEMVSKMLRHSNLNTTMKYIDLSERDLQYQHERFVG